METIAVKILIFVFFFLSVILHEYAHGLAAYYNGDDTAYLLGRLTLNPIAHIDPFGSVLLPILLWSLAGVAFGYAKPVPINPLRFKDYGRGMVVVGIAGCAVNFALGIVFSLAARFSFGIVQQILLLVGYLNFLLCFFNLVPIPPLDGSRILSVLLPAYWGAFFGRLERYGLILVFVVFMAGFAPIGMLCKFFVGHIAGVSHPI